MNSNEIREILTGNFSDPADRLYWEEKLEKTIRAEAIEVVDCVRLPNFAKSPDPYTGGAHTEPRPNSSKGDPAMPNTPLECAYENVRAFLHDNDQTDQAREELRSLLYLCAEGLERFGLPGREVRNLGDDLTGVAPSIILTALGKAGR